MQEHIIHKWNEEDGLFHDQLVKIYQSKIEKLLPEYKRRCGTCDVCVDKVCKCVCVCVCVCVDVCVSDCFEKGKPWDFFHTCFPTTSPSKFPLKDATLHNGVGHCPILVLFSPCLIDHKQRAKAGEEPGELGKLRSKLLKFLAWSRH